MPPIESLNVQFFCQQNMQIFRLVDVLPVAWGDAQPELPEFVANNPSFCSSYLLKSGPQWTLWNPPLIASAVGVENRASLPVEEHESEQTLLTKISSRIDTVIAIFVRALNSAAWSKVALNYPGVEEALQELPRYLKTKPVSILFHLQHHRKFDSSPITATWVATVGEYLARTRKEETPLSLFSQAIKNKDADQTKHVFKLFHRVINFENFDTILTIDQLLQLVIYYKKDQSRNANFFLHLEKELKTRLDSLLGSTNFSIPEQRNSIQPQMRKLFLLLMIAQHPPGIIEPCSHLYYVEPQLDKLELIVQGLANPSNKEYLVNFLVDFYLDPKKNTDDNQTLTNSEKRFLEWLVHRNSPQVNWHRALLFANTTQIQLCSTSLQTILPKLKGEIIVAPALYSCDAPQATAEMLNWITFACFQINTNNLQILNEDCHQTLVMCCLEFLLSLFRDALRFTDKTKDILNFARTLCQRQPTQDQYKQDTLEIIKKTIFVFATTQISNDVHAKLLISFLIEITKSKENLLNTIEDYLSKMRFGYAENKNNLIEMLRCAGEIDLATQVTNLPPSSPANHV